MSNRDLVIMTTKVSRAHKAKLEDIARHDTESSGKRVTRSTLVRQAIARLISGRKAVLYGHKDAFGQTLPVPDNDRKGE